jgi:hypothetical protein
VGLDHRLFCTVQIHILAHKWRCSECKQVIQEAKALKDGERPTTTEVMGG